MSSEEPRVCSARGCEHDAQQAIAWNNPKIHTPDRRKIWLACHEHESHLREFLSRRGFYLDTHPIDTL